MADVLPPFPTDPQAIDLLDAAVRPGPNSERSSVNELCMLMTDLSGVTQNPDDPWCYHPNDIIAALIDEIQADMAALAAARGGATWMLLRDDEGTPQPIENRS